VHWADHLDVDTHGVHVPETGRHVGHRAHPRLGQAFGMSAPRFSRDCLREQRILIREFQHLRHHDVGVKIDGDRSGG
jgi:hypothetical protein